MKGTLAIHIPERSNGFGHVLYNGRDIATAYQLDYFDDARVWAEIICKINDWPKEHEADVALWLHRKGLYQKAKSQLSGTKNPFADNGEFEDMKTYEEAKAAKESRED